MSRTILIVDDAAIIRAMIQDAVVEAGWTVVGEADDGETGIEKYRQLRPDAVTLDLVMPRSDGLYALRGIRELDPQARVVVVSALDQTEVLREAFQAGAADFLVKPFDKQLLLETLDRLVPSEEAPTA